MKMIPLTQGKFVIVSDHRHEYLSQWKWVALRIKEKWYAVRRGRKGEQSLILMHRVITNAPVSMDVDHKDNDGLNCQDENLRICTRSENMANRRKLSNNTSGFKGVTWRADGKPWVAQIGFRGQRIYIGRYDDPEVAARAYDAKAREFYGPFANTNFTI